VSVIGTDGRPVAQDGSAATETGNLLASCPLYRNLHVKMLDCIPTKEGFF
jgi:hypothetical protein